MGKHVLCIDDEALMRQLVTDVLQQHGFQVSLAPSGKDGLESARRRPPDLIVLDIMMPGMDGFEVCQEIRRDPRLQRIPVIMLTAMDSTKLNEQAFAAGAEVCMTKPFVADRLINVVNIALQSAALKNKPKPKNGEAAGQKTTSS